MLIQYFTGRDLAMMTTKDCFTSIKNKDLWIPYLYPGARQDQGKHKMESKKKLSVNIYLIRNI